MLELIQDVVKGNVSNSDAANSESKKFPPAAVALPFPRTAVAAAGTNANESHPAQISASAGQATQPAPTNWFGGGVPAPFADHHSDQEDYLWGV